MKACVRCKALVPDDTNICPVCGGREFSDRWDGMVAVLDPDNSKVASMLGIKKAGLYALKVRTRRSQIGAE
ncbi:transcription elongation factor subunit Spt4 [Tardisphaera saccharovorans]